MRRAARWGALLLLAVGTVDARDEIRIVGSAAALPSTHVVAEHFAQSSNYAAPSLDLTGAAIGFREFCAGVGFEHPDVNVTSRRMTAVELSDCEQHGVTSISEIKVGQEVILLVNSKSAPPMPITTPELFRALAEEVPVGSGELQANPYKKWSDIRADLPKVAIQVMGPPSASPTHDAFMALVMDRGCQSFAELQDLEPERLTQVCRSPRRDDAYLRSRGRRRELITLAAARPSNCEFDPRPVVSWGATAIPS